jgi:dipeptidyl aminopeptidase/acylaminoacyl peptidase
MTTTPGAWPSPITAELAVAAGRGLDAVAFAGDEIWWSELRPTENGRTVVCRRTPTGDVQDLLPPGSNARTRVHEYGGTSWLPVPAGAGSGIAWAEFADQRLWWAPDAATAPVPLTPAPERPAGLRYADLSLDTPRRRLLAVRELHEGDGTYGTVRRTVVAIPLDGSAADRPEAVVDLLDGTVHADFLASPRLSPDGRSLLVVGWDHPDMPWDSTVVVLVPLSADGLPDGPARTVAGGPGVSAVDPGFLSDGSIALLDDETGWWQPVLADPTTGDRRRLSDAEADFTPPQWTLGRRRWAALPGGRLLVAPGGRPAVLDTLDGSTTALDPAWQATGDLAVTPAGRMALIVGGPQLDTRLVLVEPDGSRHVLRRTADTDLPTGFLPLPEHRTIDGVHAQVYLPTHPDHRAAPGTSPLLVTVHGGPTAASSVEMSLRTAYFTSRGFVVAAVDYRGSTGYGRPYRDALRGHWGELDVADAITVARGLLADGTAGAAVVDGGSAGGLTVLGALTTPGNAFAAGISLYGVADLHALAAHTHDFESRYLDGLVGSDPQVWHDRSPLNRADALATPVLLLQGGKDPIVPPQQAELFAAACAARGIPHALVLFPEESHGFRAAAARVQALEAELSFIGQILGFDPPGVPRVELSGQAE